MSTLAPWQRSALDQALAAHRERRLAHALLLAGPERMGKREVALALAHHLLCPTPGGDGLACGRCRDCQLLQAGSHPDFRHETLEANEKTGKLRTEIVIEQVRSLGQWLAMTPQRGGALVAIIEPADAMNTATSNALLKTLEEPGGNRFLLLVSDRPGRLPATIRSRCQRLLFRPPGHEEALAWLQARGHAAAEAAQALSAALGHPGQADHWLREGGLALRKQVAADLSALAEGRAQPVETAQRWLADEQGELRLRFAADLARQAVARRLGIAGPDLPGLTAPADFQKLSTWYDGVNRVREQLPAPIRSDLLLAGLLLEWRNLYSENRRGARA